MNEALTPPAAQPKKPERPSNQALMTRAVQIAQRLNHTCSGSDVTFVYEQLQHVRRYAALSSASTPENEGSEQQQNETTKS